MDKIEKVMRSFEADRAEYLKFKSTLAKDGKDVGETINEFIRTNDFKLIHEIVFFSDGSKEEKYELYDLSEDKEEQNNIINEETEIANKLIKKLNKWAKDTKPKPE